MLVILNSIMARESYHPNAFPWDACLTTSCSQYLLLLPFDQVSLGFTYQLYTVATHHLRYNFSGAGTATQECERSASSR